MRSTSPPLHPSALMLPFSFLPVFLPLSPPHYVRNDLIPAELCLLQFQRALGPDACSASMITASVSSIPRVLPQTHTHTSQQSPYRCCLCKHWASIQLLTPPFIPTGKGKYLWKFKILPLLSINFLPHILLLLHLHFELCITALHH